MDRFTVKQQQISQRQAELLENFPALWKQMISEWQHPGIDDRCWLIYSANYLFRTNNVHWAIDPVRLRHRFPQAPVVDVAQDLNNLSFVLLTHQHADHLDLDLIGTLKHSPILWVIPEAILKLVKSEVALPAKRIIVPRPLHPIDIQGIRITPFKGLHWEKQSKAGISPRGVPAMAYLAEFNDKRWLFPGDTRTYDARQLPSFGPVNGLFAHLWLGRGCAMQDELPLLDVFCKFFIGLLPDQIILTHLQEFGRDVNDYWDECHAKKVCSKIQEISRDISVNPALTGESVRL